MALMSFNWRMAHEKVVLTLVGFTGVSIAGLWYLTPILCLSRDNLINIAGFILTLAGLLMIVFQLRIDLNQNKRQAAHDFIHGPISDILEPLEQHLKALLKKDVLFFYPGETMTVSLEHATTEEIRKEITSTVGKILNFYERMAISIFKNTLDEDICYDDKGFLLLSFYGWVYDHIDQRRRDIGEMRI